ncbi:MAG: cyanophycinase [Planctomycetota bacterium]|nr:cyanophycinase [Planctomycetota bacterium]MDA1177270.1 cyanophycinase [Planctomycetota bacterium]
MINERAREEFRLGGIRGNYGQCRVVVAVRLMFVVLGLFHTGTACAADRDRSQERRESRGTAGGSLVLAGGGSLQEISPRFLELAGGQGASLVVIPTALSDEEIKRAVLADKVTSAWKQRGFGRVEVLHTRDRLQANTNDFASVIHRSKAVWFTGGRQWRLADAYLQTNTAVALHGLLARGGVIGGSSAGATIQGSFLIRGDSRSNRILVGDHTRGFGFLTQVAVDQHLLKRRRQHGLVDLRGQYPDLLGIGIDEDTAVIVQGDILEVIGRSVVGIYDGSVSQISTTKSVNSAADHWLSAGQRYDLRSRQVCDSPAILSTMPSPELQH